MLRIFVFAVVVGALTWTAAWAQSVGGSTDTDGNDTAAITHRSWRFERGAKEQHVEFGFAPMQPTFFSGRKEYDTDGRKLALASFRWGRVIGTAKGITWEYYFELIPAAFAMKNEVVNPKFVSEKETPNERPTIRKTTFGMGFEPAGFKLYFLPNRRFKPYVQAGAGFIFTKKPIPVPQSPRYNFIGDFGGGLVYSLDRTHTMNFGYRYFHISNMNIGEINPGYNASVFFFGFSRFYK